MRTDEKVSETSTRQKRYIAVRDSAGEWGCMRAHTHAHTSILDVCAMHAAIETQTDVSRGAHARGAVGEGVTHRFRGHGDNDTPVRPSGIVRGCGYTRKQTYPLHLCGAGAKCARSQHNTQESGTFSPAGCWARSPTWLL